MRIALEAIRIACVDHEPVESLLPEVAKRGMAQVMGETGRFELWQHGDRYDNKVYVLPKVLDEKVARLHLDKPGVTLTGLTPTQAAYLGVPVKGPFKPEAYRY